MIRIVLLSSMLLLALSFQERICGQNQPMQFELLKPAHTNIYFNNELRDTPEANIMLYSNFYGGGGVGIGDINNDGLQDIFFAGNQVADRLYLNKGNMVLRILLKRPVSSTMVAGLQAFYWAISTGMGLSIFTSPENCTMKNLS
jgi:hypothetical protein